MQDQGTSSAKKRWQTPHVETVVNVKETRGAVAIFTNAERGSIYVS